LAKCEALATAEGQYSKAGCYEKSNPLPSTNPGRFGTRPSGYSDDDEMERLERLMAEEARNAPDRREVVKDLRAGWEKEKNPSHAVYPGLNREYEYKPGDGCGLKDPTRTIVLPKEIPLDWHHDEGYDDDRIAAVIIIKRKRDTRHRRIEVMPNVTAVIMNR
jgi:hypothetical protein